MALVPNSTAALLLGRKSMTIIHAYGECLMVQLSLSYQDLAGIIGICFASSWTRAWTDSTTKESDEQQFRVYFLIRYS